MKRTQRNLKKRAFLQFGGITTFLIAKLIIQDILGKKTL